jgi:hypothetical protein
VSYPTEGLITIGAGLTVYLIGAFKYLNALTELGPSEDEL